MVPQIILSFYLMLIIFPSLVPVSSVALPVAVFPCIYSYIRNSVNFSFLQTVLFDFVVTSMLLSAFQSWIDGSVVYGELFWPDYEGEQVLTVYWLIGLGNNLVLMFPALSVIDSFSSFFSVTTLKSCKSCIQCSSTSTSRLETTWVVSRV